MSLTGSFVFDCSDWRRLRRWRWASSWAPSFSVSCHTFHCHLIIPLVVELVETLKASASSRAFLSATTPTRSFETPSLSCPFEPWPLSWPPRPVLHGFHFASTKQHSVARHKSTNLIFSWNVGSWQFRLWMAHGRQGDRQRLPGLLSGEDNCRPGHSHRFQPRQCHPTQ